jgi:UPF0271 protein
VQWVTSQPASEQTIESIDLNADLGEHDGDGYAHDEALLALITSASIACGAHAGNRDVMEGTALRAATLGVAIGAHPSYPDRDGFGRRVLDMPLAALASSVRSQIDMMLDCAARAGTTLRYVKPHGALYNRAMTDRELAEALVECVRSADPSLAILALPDSAMAAAARASSMRIAGEAFIDRAYASDGTLVSRSEAGAVIEDAAVATSRAVRIARDHSVESIDGTVIGVDAESLCIHGDNPHALRLLEVTREALEQTGIRIAPFA